MKCRGEKGGGVKVREDRSEDVKCRDEQSRVVLSIMSSEVNTGVVRGEMAREVKK